VCRGGSRGTQMLLDSSSSFQALSPRLLAGCAPLLKQLSVAHVSTARGVCVSGPGRAALMTLPVGWDAAAARQDPRAARGGAVTPCHHPSHPETWATGSAHPPFPRKANQGCCDPRPVCVVCSGFQFVLGTAWKCR